MRRAFFVCSAVLPNGGTTHETTWRCEGAGRLLSSVVLTNAGRTHETTGRCGRTGRRIRRSRRGSRTFSTLRPRLHAACTRTERPRSGCDDLGVSEFDLRAFWEVRSLRQSGLSGSPARRSLSFRRPGGFVIQPASFDWLTYLRRASPRLHAVPRDFAARPAARAPPEQSVRGRASIFGRCRRYFPGLAISFRLWQTCRRVWLGISRLRGRDGRFRARPESDRAKAVAAFAKPESVLPKPEIRAGIFPFLMHGVGIARGGRATLSAGEGRHADRRFGSQKARRQAGRGRRLPRTAPFLSGPKRFRPLSRNRPVRAGGPAGRPVPPKSAVRQPDPSPDDSRLCTSGCSLFDFSQAQPMPCVSPIYPRAAPKPPGRIYCGGFDLDLPASPKAFVCRRYVAPSVRFL